MAAIAAANLSDGRTQVWMCTNTQLQSRYKETTDPNGQWTNWSSFPMPENVVPEGISAAPLEDGRLELYLVDTQAGVWTAYETETNPFSPWSQWFKFS